MATQFADMPQGSLTGWVLWAQSHDWADREVFPSWYDEMTGEMVTYGDEHDLATGQWTTVEARHRTPAEMKAWAGY